MTGDARDPHLRAGTGVATAGRLPTFLLIGAMKAGTTSLYHYLSAHPQVATPRYKAPEFFVAESNWHRGIDWYRRQFPPPGPEILAVGEASNLYTKYPRYAGVPARIATHLPDVRLVYVVRDPVSRIRSHYQHRVAEGREKAAFAEAVFADPAYLDYSRYALQIEQYLEHFPREQLLVITSEELRSDRQVTMRRVYDFIGVDPDFAPADLDRDFYRTEDRPARSLVPLRVRRGLKRRFPRTRRFKELESNTLSRIRRVTGRSGGRTGPPPRVDIADALRERIGAVLADDVRRLRAHLGPDFDGWGIA
ncbi:sulfotransferase family protein [Geodermatophilus ruber]|uniref:Sulfotransferase domain-containing protein n=1 Tax=Geodermatophilus ruber TaxID=504800 RepID=A0A1I4G4V1_9ACTN|nr:sulfotransferase domain-containing protein [Geodermatophilus ruber]SFL25118.1 Sulfotransferase domain-containing protein [Geodermatophilus ruber]